MRLASFQMHNQRNQSSHPCILQLRDLKHLKYLQEHSKPRGLVNKFPLSFTYNCAILDSDSSDDPVEERKAFIALKKEGEEDELTKSFAAKTK